MAAETLVPTVHLVCKTHLDVGFTALAAEVVDRYVDGFIPSALAVAAELRAEGGPDRFVWTTGSWLIDTYLERADAAGRGAMEAGIEAGDIAWHALPFTLHSELCDPSLFAHGLRIAARLDQRFGRTTIAAKMTDVPGHTRGIVPLLAEAGVELLHIGVNPACPAPDVPPVFRWRSPDGAEVVVAYQQGGYGGLVEVEGLADALLVAHTDDNQGPQTTGQVREVFARARGDAPGADVRASTLDAFAGALRAVRDDLPVVTSEIGDTWIHGVGTDPQKVARFRELSRLRQRWIAEGDDPAGPAFARASTSLLLVAEHTWGLDEKVALPDDHRYRADELARLRAEPAGVRFEASWAEQRAYVDAALAAFPAERRAEADAALAALAAHPRVPNDGRPVAVGEAIALGPFMVTLDRTGALDRVVDGRDRQWAGPAHVLGRYRYQTFDAADYDRFHAGYNQAEPHDEWWALEDYTKPDIAEAGAVAAWWDPVHVAAAVGSDHLWITLTMPAAAVAAFGCPETVVLHWSVDAADAGALDLAVGWADKPACRLPEAGWVSFAPLVDDPDRWTLAKLGQDVSPIDVVGHGGRHLHAVGRGAAHVAPDGTVTRVDTLDAPLLAPGAPRLLDPADDRPDLAGGLHVNLHNNVWGTNFPMWNEGPAQFRFRISTAATDG